MSKNIPKKITDITGVELTPGEPDDCLGNGEHGFECYCDECDYNSLCFSEFDTKSDDEDTPDAFDLLLCEMFKDCDFRKDIDEFKSMLKENVTFSRRYKIRINRIFRERIGVSFLPYPEVDNLFERIRRKIVIAYNSHKKK